MMIGVRLRASLRAGDRTGVHARLRHAGPEHFRSDWLRDGVRGAVQSRSVAALQLYVAHAENALSARAFQAFLDDSGAMEFALGIASVARTDEDESFRAAWEAAGVVQNAGAAFTPAVRVHLDRLLCLRL